MVESVKKAALGCPHKTAFRKNNPREYRYATKHNMLNELFVDNIMI
jgi:hypothetical protein